ncbi:MAG: diacylglycerol kinase family lipid kinase [Acidimicrobiia bacterium]|nr:diacylglycerol kinase family lipid kinase [Acidimicrobiia bacterium]
MIFRNAHLIYNPNAGGLQGRKSARLVTCVSILREAGYEILLRPTSHPGHATDLARDSVSAGADLIIAAGGDGTINEVLNGMVGSFTPLAVLPAGTASVLAVETRIGRDMEKAARSFPERQQARVAVGLLKAHGQQPRHFLLMAGAGLDAEVVGRVNPAVKRRIGKGAYWLAGASMMGASLKPMQVTVNSETMSAGFALASRVRNYGGDLSIARTASLLHDSFEVVTFEGESSLPYLKYMAGVATGTHYRLEGVRVQHAQLVKFDAPPEARIGVQVDGDFGGYLPAQAELVPDAVTLLLPSTFLKAESALVK